MHPIQPMFILPDCSYFINVFQRPYKRSITLLWLHNDVGQLPLQQLIYIHHRFRYTGLNWMKGRCSHESIFNHRISKPSSTKRLYRGTIELFKAGRGVIKQDPKPNSQKAFYNPQGQTLLALNLRTIKESGRDYTRLTLFCPPARLSPFPPSIFAKRLNLVLLGGTL